MARQTLTQLKHRSSTPDWGQSTALEDVRGDVAIVGIGETEYSGPSGRSARDICLEAVARAIDDAGLTPGEIDGLMITGAVEGQITPEDFHTYFGTSHPLWFSTEGGAMTWAATCAHTAAQALKNGLARNIVNVFGVDWASRRGAHSSYHESEPMKAHFELPFGWYPQPLYFATFARRHMHQYGTSENQLGELPVTFRRHANSHPDAVMRHKPLGIEDYLSRPYLADPFRLEDCCLLSDGGAAYVMTTADRARDLKQHPVIVEGVGHGIISKAPYISQQSDITSTPQVFSAPWAFSMADLSPTDLDVIAVYDCFSMTALMQIEDMGFCKKGEGGEFIQDGRLAFDRPRRKGGIPCNTHGGFLSHAYVLGVAHVVELVKQLRGTAANQVEDARLAAYAGFTADEAATLILKKAS
jgi:acetyl-CoA acetyltransferase